MTPLLVALTVTVTACEHPIAVVSPHVEAQDLLVRDTTGRLLLRTQDNTTWSAGTMAIPLDDSLPVVIRLVDFRGNEFDLADRSREYSIRVQAENAAAVQWEPRRGAMGWLRGFVAGPTRIRFQVWHTDHPDFTSRLSSPAPASGAPPCPAHATPPQPRVSPRSPWSPRSPPAGAVAMPR
ncbi:MAG: hypothetical protein MUF21_15515 [Gemmatimonadaceae bacterium]|nr:hypothetical protein [Gemmatimonadaceae bacterium]